MMQPQHCLFCGNIVSLVHVHGHYQCPVCFTNALPCCDGDNCDTNNLLNNQPGITSGAAVPLPRHTSDPHKGS